MTVRTSSRSALDVATVGAVSASAAAMRAARVAGFGFSAIAASFVVVMESTRGPCAAKIAGALIGLFGEQRDVLGEATEHAALRFAKLQMRRAESFTAL
jgi:hypothetical protein